MSRDCQALIHLPALVHNLSVIRQHAPNSRCVAVIKADAYGHGMVEVAKSLSEVDMLAVATIDEALVLRTEGVRAEILLLEGFHNQAELKCCLQHKLTPVIHAQHQLVLLESAMLVGSTKHLPKSIWLKVETGMHRLGLPIDLAQRGFVKLKKTGSDLVWMTHLANAEIENDPLNALQIERFDKIVSTFPAPHSIANSAATWSIETSQRDWIRPGLLLYGLSPFPGKTGPELGLQPVMCLHSELISINTCQRGDQVGYGSRYICQQDTYIGVLAIGYGDGYPRHAKDKTPVWINGRQVPLAGTPSMDMLTVDLGPVLQDKVGDIAELWGNNVPVETVAMMSGTIAYELTCKILPRVERILTY